MCSGAQCEKWVRKYDGWELRGSSRAMKPRGEFLFVLAAVIVMVLHVTVWGDYTYMWRKIFTDVALVIVLVVVWLLYRDI